MASYKQCHLIKICFFLQGIPIGIGDFDSYFSKKDLNYRKLVISGKKLTFLVH